VDLAPLRFSRTFALFCLVLVFSVDLGYAAAGSGTWVAALLGLAASGLGLAWLSLRQLRRRRSRHMTVTELDMALTVRSGPRAGTTGAGHQAGNTPVTGPQCAAYRSAPRRLDRVFHPAVRERIPTVT